MISGYVSSKLKWLSVIATLTVVWIHSNSMAFLSDLPNYGKFLSRFLMISLTSWAVPCFFMISGFLLIHSYKNSYKDFLKKKSRSLLIPYLCWAAIGTGLTIPLTFACNFLQRKPLWSNSFVDAGKYSVFGVDTVSVFPTEHFADLLFLRFSDGFCISVQFRSTKHLFAPLSTTLYIL